MKTLLTVSVLSFCVIAVAGCMTVGDHQAALHSEADREMTVGNVQREIYIGMSGADVAQALGSPNIVTSDGQGGESWIYDKIATEASYSNSSTSVSGAVGASGIPGTTLLLGLFTGNHTRNSGASATTQKTLTVVIRFDENNLVRDFAYHTSKF